MRIDAVDPQEIDFDAVKAAVESTYSCMGITCSDVGGILKPEGREYVLGGEPCFFDAPVNAPEDTAGSEETKADTLVQNANAATGSHGQPRNAFFLKALLGMWL